MNKEKKQFAKANCFFIEIAVEFFSVYDKMMKM